MCGIVGYWDKRGASERIAENMARKILHRGPDDAGTWLNNDGNLVLGHQRLSIIDLSQAGHQPMISPCGNYSLVYNGEIYNHIDLRAELEEGGGNFDWVGQSDTETLLCALRHWGIIKTLKKLNGMFAFALWDQKKQALYLARDRMGEKPIYYGYSNGCFMFGSELKCLSSHPNWKGGIDRDALALFMQYSYIPTPYCIYKGINKLPPAHYITIKDSGRFVSKPECYWDIKNIAKEGENEKERNVEEYIDELDTLLRDAVFSRMLSDVPLGAFLSGGIDSSTVVALMQSQSQNKVKTFTLGYYEKGYNEADHAKTVAEYLGTKHSELLVTPADVMAVIPNLPVVWDEPFSDSSQIPTYLISKLAREYVTVSLSGDGGDELFCGYNRYNHGYQVWKFLRLLPKSARKLVSNFLNAVPGRKLEHLIHLLPKRFHLPHFAGQLEKLADVVLEEKGESYYYRLVSHLSEQDNLIKGKENSFSFANNMNPLPELSDLRAYMMLLDSMTYLPDDILTKIDRASMAVSMEARVPFLDHRVVEFSWRIPMNFKYRNRQGKWLLRQVLHRYVPRKLIERPKMGFGVPIEHWLCGSLRDWAEALLDERRLREEGFFVEKTIRRMWDEHVRGKRHWHFQLWDVLMFQAWLENTRSTRDW